MPWCWYGRRMGLFNSALTSDDSTHGQRRIPTLSPGYKKCWRVWPELRISPLWTSKVDFGRSVWARVAGSIPRSRLATWVSMSSPGCPLDCVMHLRHSSILCRTHWGELNLTYCIIYLDDVIVYGRTEEEHLEHLRIVLEHFREFNLKLKPSKCSFFQSEIVYLAHHVSKEGIRLSDDNI